MLNQHFIGKLLIFRQPDLLLMHHLKSLCNGFFQYQKETAQGILQRISEPFCNSLFTATFIR